MFAGVILLFRFIFVRKFPDLLFSQRITALALSGQLLAMEATVESETSPCGIFGGHSGTKTCFLTQVIRVSPTVVPELDSSQDHHSRFSNCEFPFLTAALGTESHLLVQTVSFGPSCCYD
jgi:hypothetical protein